MLCWMNGQITSENEMFLSPFDHGVLYGHGSFETFRSYSGKVVFLDYHFSRLSHTLAVLHIYIPFTLDEFQRTLSVTYTENSDTFIGDTAGSLYTDNFSITVRGNGILYDQTIIFDLQYSGKQLDKQQSLRGNNITLIAKKN